MLTRPIPSTGEQVPVIGLGTFRSFDKRLNSRTRTDLTEVLQLFFDGGGSLIDSSPMYGRAEETVGTLLSEMNAHHRAFIATKVWTTGHGRGISQMEESLHKLQADPIALMQVHNLVDCDTQLATLKEWKAAGLIKYLGLTHYTVSGFRELIAYIKQGGIDFVQFPYSIAVREAEERLFPACEEYGVATLINRPFEQDGLFRWAKSHALPELATDLGCNSWGQFFLKYIIGQAGVTCAIPATSSPEHMRDNLSAGVGVVPTADQRREMRSLLENG